MSRGSQATIGDIIRCVNHPDTLQRFAGLLASWPSVILWVGFLVQIGGLLKIASQPGALYSQDTAARLRRIGWFLTAGALAAAIIQTVADLMIPLTQIRYPGLNWFEPDKLHLSVSACWPGWP